MGTLKDKNGIVKKMKNEIFSHVRFSRTSTWFDLAWSPEFFRDAFRRIAAAGAEG
jgi:hypothetical protein